MSFLIQIKKNTDLHHIMLVDSICLSDIVKSANPTLQKGYIYIYKLCNKHRIKRLIHFT